MLHGHLDYFQKSLFGGRSNTKPGDHDSPNANNRWFILVHHVWGPAWLEIHWNSSWLRARSHMTLHYTWGSVTILHDFGGVLGRALDTFFLGSRNFMVIALSLCVSGPYSHRNISFSKHPNTTSIWSIFSLTCWHGSTPSIQLLFVKSHLKILHQGRYNDNVSQAQNQLYKS
jgi:hypothetical protein